MCCVDDSLFYLLLQIYQTGVFLDVVKDSKSIPDLIEDSSSCVNNMRPTLQLFLEKFIK